MNILDPLYQTPLHGAQNILGYVNRLRGGIRSGRPVAPQGMSLGAVQNFHPGFQFASPDVEIPQARHDNHSNILQGIDTWNGAPMQNARPVQMPQVLGPNPMRYEDGRTLHRRPVDTGINARRTGNLPIYIKV